jgi:hypothetical protein
MDSLRAPQQNLKILKMTSKTACLSNLATTLRASDTGFGRATRDLDVEVGEGTGEEGTHRGSGKTCLTGHSLPDKPFFSIWSVVVKKITYTQGYQPGARGGCLRTQGTRIRRSA